MGGFVLRGLNNLGQEDGGEAVRHRDPYHLGAQDLEVLRQKAIIWTLPDVRELDITDRCKTDVFVKAIAMLQIIWSSTQIVVRFALNLTVSPLEMSVVAFAVCALMIYGLYWRKPMGPEGVLTVHYDDTRDDVRGALRLALSNRDIASDSRGSLLDWLVRGTFSSIVGPTFPEGGLPKIRRVIREPGSPFGPDDKENPQVLDATELIAGACSATAFGVVHFGAWGFPFPTFADTLVWKVCTVYTSSYALVSLFYESMGIFNRVTGNFATKLLTIIYVLARLAILVEVVSSLFFLPPSTFASTWTTNIPHFA